MFTNRKLYIAPTVCWFHFWKLLQPQTIWAKFRWSGFSWQRKNIKSNWFCGRWNRPRIFFSSYHMPVIVKVEKNSRIRYKSTQSMQMKETAKEKQKQISDEFTDAKKKYHNRYIVSCPMTSVFRSTTDSILEWIWIMDIVDRLCFRILILLVCLGYRCLALFLFAFKENNAFEPYYQRS